MDPGPSHFWAGLSTRAFVPLGPHHFRASLSTSTREAHGELCGASRGPPDPRDRVNKPKNPYFSLLFPGCLKAVWPEFVGATEWLHNWSAGMSAFVKVRRGPALHVPCSNRAGTQAAGDSLAASLAGTPFGKYGFEPPVCFELGAQNKAEPS